MTPFGQYRSATLVQRNHNMPPYTCQTWNTRAWEHNRAPTERGKSDPSETHLAGSPMPTVFKRTHKIILNATF